MTACGNNHQTCNDDDAKKEVLEVIHSHIDNIGGFDSRIKTHLRKRYLSNVSTTESDKELGRYSCSAIYNYEFKSKTRTVQISYLLKYLECWRQCNRDQRCQSNIDQGLKLVPLEASCG